MEKRSDKEPAGCLMITTTEESSELETGLPRRSEEASISASTDEDLGEIPAPKLSFGSRGTKGTVLKSKCSQSN
jgi:hypothetical protein